MSNEKFTQGEWKAVVEHNVIDTALVYFSDRGGINLSAAPNPIPNAHLISAAPNMYRALSEVNTAISESKSEIELADKVTSLCHNISQALEKARGEQ